MYLEIQSTNLRFFRGEVVLGWTRSHLCRSTCGKSTTSQSILEQPKQVKGRGRMVFQYLQTSLFDGFERHGEPVPAGVVVQHVLRQEYSTFLANCRLYFVVQFTEISAVGGIQFFPITSFFIQEKPFPPILEFYFVEDPLCFHSIL